MKLFRQIGAVTAMNLRSLPQRVGTSLVIVIGIAGVVAVLVSVLAMSTGMLETMEQLGTRRSRHRAAQRLGVRNWQRARPRRGAARRGRRRRQARQPTASRSLSAEALRLVNLLTRRRTAPRSTSRCAASGRRSPRCARNSRSSQGRMFKPAVNEIIVGKAAHAQFKGLNIGDQITTRGATWTVVGIFTSGGDSHESELMADAETLTRADQRGGFQSVTVMLESPAAFQKFKDSLTANPALAVDVQSRARVLPASSRRPSARSSTSSPTSSAASWRSARSSVRSTRCTRP